MPVVNLPDGKRINFPAGTPPAEMQAVIEQASGNAGMFGQQAAGMDPLDLSVARSKNDDFGNYLRAQASQPQQGETPDQTFQRQYGGISTPEVGMGEGVVRSGLQGASFGTGDEMVAAGAAALNKAMGKDPGREFGELYDAYLARERGDIGQFREDHPVAAIGSEVAGAIPTAFMAPGVRAGQFASLPTRMGVGGLNAATQGGIYGFNAGEGGAEDRIENAAKTAAIAAPIGMAAPAVGAGARNLAQRLMTNKAAQSVGQPRAAYDVLVRTMDADGSLNGPGAARIRAGGSQAMLADAGPNTASLLDTAVQKSGPAATVARAAIDDRVAQAGRGVTSALDDALGVPGQSTSRAVIKYGDKTNPLNLIYKRAYETPIDYAAEPGRRIESLIRDRVPSDAIKAANKLMQIEGEKSSQILASMADDGSVTFRQMPDVRQIDYITRGLNEVAEQADGMGKMGGTTQTGRAYANLSREIRSALKESVPEYKAALDSAAGLIREGKAKEFGAVVLSPRTTRSDVVEMVSDMGAAEMRKVGEGLRMQIDDTLANVKRAMMDSNTDAREAVKAIKDISSRAAREKVKAIIGEQKSKTLFDRLDQAATAFDLRANVAANSKTFARTSIDDAIRAQTDDGVINTLRSGEPVNAGKRLVQTLMGRTPAAKERMSDQTYSAIVDALTGPGALQTIQKMQQAQTMIPQGSRQYGRLAEMLMGRNAALVAPARENLR